MLKTLATLLPKRLATAGEFEPTNVVAFSLIIPYNNLLRSFFFFSTGRELPWDHKLKPGRFNLLMSIAEVIRRGGRRGRGGDK